MIGTAKSILLAVTLLTLTSVNAGAKDTLPPEAKALFQQGTAAATALAWEQAVECFSKAHQLARRDASIYYALGVAHEKTGHLLPAMAWYTAYITVVPNGDKANFAREGIASLDMAIQGKLRSVFTYAEKLAKVSGYKEGPDFALLADIARWEQSAGLLAMSKATRQLMKDHAGIRNWDELQYSAYLIPELKEQDLDRLYLYSLTHSGDLSALRNRFNYLLTFDLQSDRGNGLYTSAEEYLLQAEINHFLLTSDRMSRVTVAESLSKRDPLQNIDVKVAHELQTSKDAKKIVERLEWLAMKIWEPLHTLHALYPSKDDSHYLSEASLAYLDASLAYVKKRESGADDDNSLKLVWGEQQNFEKAHFLASSLKDPAGNDRLTLYRTGNAWVTYDDQEKYGYLGILTEKPLQIEGGFRSLVWSRRVQGKWKVYREITRSNFQNGVAMDLGIFEIRSFDPKSGMAVVQIGETGRDGRTDYSWSQLDLIKKKRVRVLPK